MDIISATTGVEAWINDDVVFTCIPHVPAVDAFLIYLEQSLLPELYNKQSISLLDINDTVS